MMMVLVILAMSLKVLLEMPLRNRTLEAPCPESELVARTRTSGSTEGWLKSRPERGTYCLLQKISIKIVALAVTMID
ncbi:hypothetical protein RHMOL_Rhmol10G0122600 [Rhododendron molle]|uniref:Uncharacterized protein n=1 Tax=Rhododendron molle TaxID=49168 RepID=A0ACC0M2J1_RHOML|nr:hypothetical protein RHMOL_Rhmol10G0122600 [Rhododendron molle]